MFLTDADLVLGTLMIVFIVVCMLHAMRSQP